MRTIIHNIIIRMLLVFVLIITTGKTYGQELFTRLGVNYTDFNFKNDEERFLKTVIEHKLSFGIGYREKIKNSPFNYQAGLQFYNFNLKAHYNGFNEYSINQLAPFLGFFYNAFSSPSGQYKFFIGTNLHARILLSGYQITDGNELYRASEAEEFKRPIIGFNIELKNQFNIKKNLAMSPYLTLGIDKALTQKDNQLILYGYQIGVDIAINLN